jgi:hypothetical protein
VAAAVVVVLLVLIGLGILAPLGPPAGQYTVQGVTIQLVQGTNPGGGGWFGNNTQTIGAPTYPATFTAGSSFQLRWTFSNFDTSGHNITSVTAAPPFSVVSVSPALPAYVSPHADNAYLLITLSVPNSAGGSGAVTLTVTVRS